MRAVLARPHTLTPLLHRVAAKQQCQNFVKHAIVTKLFWISQNWRKILWNTSATDSPLPSTKRFFITARQCYLEMKTIKLIILFHSVIYDSVAKSLHPSDHAQFWLAPFLECLPTCPATDMLTSSQELEEGETYEEEEEAGCCPHSLLRKVCRPETCATTPDCPAHLVKTVNASSAHSCCKKYTCGKSVCVNNTVKCWIFVLVVPSLNSKPPFT